MTIGPSESANNRRGQHEMTCRAEPTPPRMKTFARAYRSNEDGDYDSSLSCLIRNPHGKTIADHFEFAPTDQQLIDAQRNVAGLVASSFHDGAQGEREEVADGEAHDGHVDAEGAWQPWHPVKQFFLAHDRSHWGKLGKPEIRILD